MPCVKERVSVGHEEETENTHEVVENLITYDPGHLKALLAVDRIHYDVAMDSNEVLGV